jgi:hypothetical protein
MGERLILVIMIDALGHRIVKDCGVFAELGAPGRPVPSVCGYSSACIPSLLTGRLPVEHGHWAMYLRDPERSVFRRHGALIALASGMLGRNGFTRRMITRSLHLAGITGYFSLYDVPPRLLPQFDLCERRDIFSPGAFPTWATPFDAAASAGVPFRVWSWRTPEQRNRDELRAAIAAGSHGMLFFYSPHLDAVMHAHGTRSDATRECLNDFADFTHEMLALAQRTYRDVRLFVFGDHGMADVQVESDLMPRIEALGLKVPGDALYFVDSTMARFWFHRPGLRARVEEVLRATPGGRILDDEECAHLGVLFPDRRYGELVFLADAGTIFVPSFMGPSGCRAMHGYHPGDVDSDTLVVSNAAHMPVRSIMDIGPLLTAEIEALAAGAPAPGAEPVAAAGKDPGAGPRAKDGNPA